MKNLLESIVALGLLGGVASAGVITQVSTRAGLAANDLVVWETTPASDGSSVASPYSRTSTGGVGVQAFLTGGFNIFLEGAGSFAGNFAPGDYVLDSAFTDGPISIVFGSVVRGVGFNVQRNDYGAFGYSLAAYGAGNVLFGTVTGTGNSTGANNGTAVFAGLISNLKDILRVDISVNNAVRGSNALDINQISLLTTNPSGVPEPGTIGLVSVALAGLALVRRRG